ncbi:restriction endonuclease subunit S [Pantoea ananatis]|uniref:restriction endonuclease subunit S n=1 Tax=Pantoea ananas TaxID=553 RepID=UPI001589FDA2|nr:restriction endonuclease subunit S [Pantoea ananatis]MBA4822435.1 restriction endonuclease subunit S [Pantoea ananatis]QKV89571.1 restriction endonuclease subunit S [Pantoea ananatis]
MNKTTDARVIEPKLRFPEFLDAGAWSVQSLGKLAKRSTRKNIDGALNRVLTNSAEHGVVDQRDYFDKDIANQGNLNGYYIVEMGAYVYNPRISTTAPVGPISKNRIGTGVMSPLYTILNFNNGQNDFYAHYFKSTHWHLYMRQSSSTGARHDRMSISNDAFMGLPLPVSTQEEQQKIADCLASIDDLITFQRQKVDELKAHKEGLLQQLFPADGEPRPKLRFPEFLDAGAWSFQSLGKLAKRSTRKNIDGALNRVLTNSAEHGVVDQRDYFDKDIANQGNLNGYYIVEMGAYVYNPRISTTAPVGPISKNRIGTGVMSPLYTILNFNNGQNDFYAHYFKSTHWHLYMRQSSSTGARHDRMSISNDAFMGLPLPVSTQEEQQKIADCLASIDDLITFQRQKVDELKAHKEGLLQQLFPQIGETVA